MSIKQDLIDAERKMAQLKFQMGNEKFEEWVQSVEINKFTNFTSFEELKTLLKKAEFDVVRVSTNQYLYVKTCISGKDNCIYWLTQDGRIVASVGTYLKNDFNNFIHKVEKTLGYKCFFDDEKSADTLPEQTFPTTFTNKYILKKALQNIKKLAIITKKGFAIKMKNYDILIERSKHSNYTFKVVGHADTKEAYQYYKKLNKEYEKENQKQICENIKQKINTSRTMKLESEKVLEDESVLLTVIM